MGRVLLVSADIVGGTMAGPGIRSWEFARLLSAKHDVTVAAPPPLPDTPPGFRVIEARRSEMAAAAAGADALIVQGSALDLFPALAGLTVPLVVDLYDPYLLENLEIHADQPMADRLAIHDRDLAVLRQQAIAGDFFMCASERQRQLWLGVLSAVNRVNPLTYAEDPTLGQLLAVVPFGLPDRPIAKRPPAMRGVIPGIGQEDVIALWGGGIWNWFDPLTLIEAVGRVSKSHPELKLVFMGTQHPNPAVPKMRMAADAFALSKRLGLTGRHVFFNEGWVPYEEREGFLAEADIGVSLHLQHLETLFSFRTRILDYLWAGLPMLVTEGDSMADLVRQEGLGVVVRARSVEDVAAGFGRLLTDPPFRAGCATEAGRISANFRWSVVARPLLEFCGAPRRSPDAQRRVAAASPGLGDRTVSGRATARIALRVLRQEGLRPFARRTYRFLRKRLT